MARSGDWITAGDGLEAFGAALILAEQMHFWGTETTAGQLICAGRAHAWRPRLTKN